MGALKQTFWILGNALTCGALERIVEAAAHEESAPPETPESFEDLQKLHIGDPLAEEAEARQEKVEARKELAEHDKRHQEFLEWARNKGAKV